MIVFTVYFPNLCLDLDQTSPIAICLASCPACTSGAFVLLLEALPTAMSPLQDLDAGGELFSWKYLLQRAFLE